MPKFRKKLVVIEAVQWTGENREEIGAFARSAITVANDGLPFVGKFSHTGCIQVITLEGSMLASKGDWIIKGIREEFYPIREEFYPCKPDIFAATYEEVEGSSQV